MKRFIAGLLSFATSASAVASCGGGPDSEPRDAPPGPAVGSPIYSTTCLDANLAVVVDQNDVGRLVGAAREHRPSDEEIRLAVAFLALVV